MEQSPNEAYIAVENMVDNEDPSRDIIYMSGCAMNLNSKKLRSL